MAANEPAGAKIGAAAINAAVRSLAATKLKPKTDSMLRVFLAFKAMHRGGPTDIDTLTIKSTVQKLFTVLPTPPDVRDPNFNGTLALRGDDDGRPLWLKNDSYRGSFQDYAGPSKPGRHLFVGSDYRQPLAQDAVDQVAATLGNQKTYAWPSRYALAVIALRTEELDPALQWEDLSDLARERFGLTLEEWEKITSTSGLSVDDPFYGAAWQGDPTQLDADLRPAGLERVKDIESELTELPDTLQGEVERVLRSLERNGASAIVALAGVPGTSKSHVARIAGRSYASEGCYREIQFSPGYTYEEFMEGPRFDDHLKTQIKPGIFLDFNREALENPDKQYVLLIEEFTRADLPRVLGELLTYVEYRNEDDQFQTLYARDRTQAKTTRIAPNLAILTTYNPTDRSAVALDAAIIRRLCILEFPPNTALLREILQENGVEPAVTETLVSMFEACAAESGDRYAETMPFGHAVFAAVTDEAELHDLWEKELKHLLVRPNVPKHQLYDTIVANYPWHRGASETVVPTEVASGEPVEDSDGSAESEEVAGDWEGDDASGSGSEEGESGF